MKFNSFLARLSVKENIFSGIIRLNDNDISVGFKRIIDDFFLCNSKKELNFYFSQKIFVKSRNKELEVILPLFSSYNKKKLIKVVKKLLKDDEINPYELVIDYLNFEKFFSAEYLIDFLKVSKEEIINYVMKAEIDKRIKIIDINKLTICSYDFFLNLAEDLYNLLNEYFSSRTKIIYREDIEKKLNIPFDNTFFKYLLRKVSGDFELRLMKNKIIFDNLPLSDEEKANVEEVKEIIKKNKMNIFSISNIVKISSKSSDKVNDALWSMLGENLIVQLDEKNEYFVFSDELNRIINRLKKFKRNQGDIIDISDLREMTSYNRKNIIILFEYLDSIKFTSRKGNKRVIELSV